MKLEIIDLIKAYRAIEPLISQLTNHIYQELNNYPLWIADELAEHWTEDKSRLSYILHLNSSCGETPQETFACPGVVAANLYTLKYVQAVNAAKIFFKQTVQAYLKENNLPNTQLIRQYLKQAGYPAVKLKLVYRTIRTIDFHPRRIAFTQVRHNSHCIITPTQAEKKLRAVGQGANIEVQLQQLKALKPNDRLVIHRDVKPLWIANIATFKNQEGVSNTTNIMTSLPIFYLHDLKNVSVQVVFSKKTNRVTTVRSDKLIEEVPYLPSISAYRYRHLSKK